MDPNANTIRVDAQGTADGVPDRASVVIGVSVLERTVAKASGRASRVLKSVLDTVQNHGVDRSDLHTVAHSVRPEYDHSGRSRRMAGYRVADSVSVTIRSIDGLGAIVDAATAVGGDDVTVDRIVFDIDDSQELEATARERAWRSAVDKATQLAALAQVELGSPTSIQETAVHRPGPILPRAAAMAAPVDTPIEAGTLTVDVGLTVAFAIV